MEGWMKGGEKVAGNERRGRGRDRGEVGVMNWFSPVWSGE